MKKFTLLLTLTLSYSLLLSASEGALRGRFAISAKDTIAFSRGNLQYQPGTGIWRFAENQWDYVGNSSMGTVYEDGVKSNNSIFYTYTYAYGYKYKGWMDLFGWGTGTRPTTGTTSNSDYASYNEWGKNKIANGGNANNLWRTMTITEWDYLFNKRENATMLYGMANVNNVNGAVLLPDDWVMPADLTFTPQALKTDASPANRFTADEWILMEMAGAVFLPITLERNMTPWYTSYCHEVYSEQTARYWSATNSYYMTVYGIPKQLMGNVYVGKAVRLVQNHDGSELFPVMPNSNQAIFRWVSVPNASTYTLHVYEDEEKTIEICTIYFDKHGKVISIDFRKNSPSAVMEEEAKNTNQQFFYTLDNLTDDTPYWYSITGNDEQGEPIQTFEGSFRTKEAPKPTPTQIEETTNNNTNSVKEMQNGRVIIRKDNKTYNISGQTL